MIYQFSVVFFSTKTKIRPLVLNPPVTFVPRSARCSSALCLLYFCFINSPVKNVSCDSDTSDFDIVDYELQDGMVIEGDTFL